MSVQSVGAIESKYLKDIAALDPIGSELSGMRPINPNNLSDYSEDGHTQRAALAKEALAALQSVSPTAKDVAARRLMVERLALVSTGRDLGTHCHLNSESWPGMLIVKAISQMPMRRSNSRPAGDLAISDIRREWEDVLSRLNQIQPTLRTYMGTLRSGIDTGRVSTVRQVQLCIQQSKQWGGDATGNGFADHLVRNLPEFLGTSLRDELEAASYRADGAFHEVERFLEDDYLYACQRNDSVGRELHAYWAQVALGESIDQSDAYQSAWDDVFDRRKQLENYVFEHWTGKPLNEIVSELKADDSQRLETPEIALDYLQKLVGRGGRASQNLILDLPPTLQSMGVAISNGIRLPHYERPRYNESQGRLIVDFDRVAYKFMLTPRVFSAAIPGRGAQESVLATSHSRNSFARYVDIAGYSEGWSAHAERLAYKKGVIADPPDVMVHLAGRLYDAARAVVDVGLHCRFDAAGYGRWSEYSATEFLKECAFGPYQQLVTDDVCHIMAAPGHALGRWRGDAVWQSLEQHAREHTRGFDLSLFNTAALRVGPTGLESLNEITIDRVRTIDSGLDFL